MIGAGSLGRAALVVERCRTLNGFSNSRRPRVGSNLAVCPGVQEHILVVDDDADGREALIEALSDQYDDMREAANGQEAIDIIQAGRFRPGVILLDLSMPVLDGVSFLRRRAADPELGAAAVIVLSAEPSLVPELAATVAAVLPKPIPLTRLREIIDAICHDGERPRRLRSCNSDGRPPHGVERRRR